MILNINGHDYTVHFQHIQNHYVYLTRGVTRCLIHRDRCKNPDCLKSLEGVFHRLDEGHALGFGAAYCSPADQFDKKKGRIVAMRRALLRVPREERKAFWDAYFKISPHA